MIINIFYRKNTLNVLDCVILNITNRSDIEQYNQINNYICVYWDDFNEFKLNGLPEYFPNSEQIQNELPYLFL